MKTNKFMKNVFAALTAVTAAYPLVVSAKTVISTRHKPSAQEISAIENKPFLAINSPKIGPMVFSLSKSPQTGLLEILYAPPGWPKKAWDKYKIFRIETSFDQIKEITTSGDYIVVTGSLKGGAATQISALFKRDDYPVHNSILVRPGAAPVAKDPTILDVVLDGCTYVDKASNGVFVPRYMMVFGQGKEGAFTKGILDINHWNAELGGAIYADGTKDLKIGNESGLSDELVVRRDGEVEVKFDSGTSRVIGKIDRNLLPAKNTCGRIVVEATGKFTYKHSKSLRPLLENAMFFPAPRIAVKNDVKVGFEGQELRCIYLSARDEKSGFTDPKQTVRKCQSNPEQNWTLNQ